MSTYDDEHNNGNRNGRNGQNNRDNRDRDNREISWELIAKLGVLARYSNGWTKELNIVAWNGNPAKYDIRDWDPNHEHMRKGITMRKEEAEKLYEVLREQFGTTQEWDDFDEPYSMNSGPLVADEEIPAEVLDGPYNVVPQEMRQEMPQEIASEQQEGSPQEVTATAEETKAETEATTEGAEASAA